MSDMQRASLAAIGIEGADADEYYKAYRDMRADVIDEVAATMPDATSQQVVRAIVDRLDRGLPRLARLTFEIGNGPRRSRRAGRR